ncbi:MAG: DUF6171 family protein [Candidatus Hadarchaeales archaeon]
MKQPLTIALATYSDLDGAIFSIQHARFLPDFLPADRFVVVNNNPHGPETPVLRDFCNKADVIYVENPINSTSLSRELAIQSAPTDVVVVIDSHVLIAPGSLYVIRQYLSNPENERNLLHGLSLSDNLAPGGWSWLPFWRAEMLGIWSPHPEPDQPTEIWGAGLGLFVINKNFWPHFHPLHRGFGGEEGYIHEKIRRNGGKVIFHPSIRFWHRYYRVAVPYPLSKQDKIRNYLLHFFDLYGNDPGKLAHEIDRMRQHFVFREPETAPWGEKLEPALTPMTESDFDFIVKQVENEIRNIATQTTQTSPQFGFPYSPLTPTTSEPTTHQPRSGCGGCAKRRAENIQKLFERAEQILNKYNDGSLTIFVLDPDLASHFRGKFHITSTLKQIEPNLLWSDTTSCPTWLKTLAIILPIPIARFAEPLRRCFNSCQRLIIYPVHSDLHFVGTVFDPAENKTKQEEFQSTAYLLMELLKEGWRVIDSVNNFVVLEKSRWHRFIWLLKGITTAIKRFSGFATTELAKRRLNICRQCPFYRRGRCQICGCFMKAKTSIESEKCPLDKW